MPEVAGPVRPAVAGAFKVVNTRDIGGEFVKSITAKGLVTYQDSSDAEATLQLAQPAAQHAFFAPSLAFDPLTSIIAGRTTSGHTPSVPSVTYCKFPPMIARGGAALSVSLSGKVGALLDESGVGLLPGQVTPSRRYALTLDADGYFLLGGISPRPPDYKIRFGLSLDATFTGKEMLDGTSSTTPTIVMPLYGQKSFCAWGVPDNTGDIIDVTQGGFSWFIALVRIPGTVIVDGVDYKLWRTVELQNTNPADVNFIVTQATA